MMTSKNKPVTFEIGTWKDFSQDVHTANPTLAALIDELNPDESFQLIKAKYLYGESITELGTIRVPNAEGQNVPYTDSSVTPDLQKALGYCPTPLVLQLQNCSEVYSTAQERIIPLNVFYPGDLFGLFETLMPLTGSPIKPYWSVFSGIRSVFMSPKVSNSRGHGRLRKHYRSQQGTTSMLQEQWHILKNIVNDPGTNASPWHSEVILFTTRWFERQDDNLAWLKFYNFLLEQSWVQSKNIRIANELAPLWAKYTSYLGTRNYNPGIYMLSTLLHCLYIAHGAAPGFNIIGSDHSLRLPNSRIEYAYDQIYGELRGYLPALIAACPLHHAKERPLYYSLNYPTSLNTVPELKSRSNSHMNDLKQLQDYTELLYKVFTDPLERKTITNDMCLRYFHCDEDELNHISPVTDLLTNDPNIIDACQYLPGENFAFGPFFKGVIQISPVGQND